GPFGRGEPGQVAVRGAADARRDRGAPRRLGVTFPALRNGFDGSTLEFLTAGARETGPLVAPADGLVSWTAYADLAEAAALRARGPRRRVTSGPRRP
ncbi:MAG: hypothetical protein AVDCRST_MAG48-2237, partial [uncultured Friedmanniella sp.]